MQPVPDFDAITADLAIWHAYYPAVKAELYSTRLAIRGGSYLIDPVPLEKQALEELIASAPVAGIIVTNSNHYRAAAAFAQQFSAPIFAHIETFPNDQPSRLSSVADGEEICDALRVIGVEGAAPGEIVLHHMGNGGTLIVGDALINFAPYGFAFLPAKYCSNHKQMRRSLRKLLNCEAERILFAHGTPILSGASEQLGSLLNTGSS